MPVPGTEKWYEQFFTELPNEFWRAAAVPGMTLEDIGFLEGIVGATAGSSVVDIPCGSGRHSLELARRGYQVTGIDISEEAIAHAAVLATAENLDVNFFIGDMATVDLPTADAVIALGNSFAFTHPAGTVSFVSRAAHALTQGGALVIDYGAAAESILPNLENELVYTAGGIEMRATHTYNVADSCIVTDYTFSRDDETRTSTGLQYVYTAAQLRQLLCDAGFARVEMFGETDGSTFKLGDPRLLVVARHH